MVMDSLNLYTAKEIYIMNDLYKYIREGNVNAGKNIYR